MEVIRTRLVSTFKNSAQEIKYIKLHVVCSIASYKKDVFF